MTKKQMMWGTGLSAALVCVALGFAIAHYMERERSSARIEVMEQQQNRELDAARRMADDRVNAMALSQGEMVVQAFASGIAPSVLADRQDAVEISAIGMLHVPGIAGIHVLTQDGRVIYSSDAKLTATGEGDYRGGWALQATELTKRASSRPGVFDIAAPIASAGPPQAVVWLEFDAAAAKAAVQDTAAVLAVAQ